MLHSCVSLLAPTHEGHPSTGGGLLHRLKRCRCPPPQLVVHTVHQDQSDHPAGNGSRKNKNNYTVVNTLQKYFRLRHKLNVNPMIKIKSLLLITVL